MGVIQFWRTRWSEFNFYSWNHSLCFSAVVLHEHMTGEAQMDNRERERERKLRCSSKPNFTSHSSWWEGVELFSVLPLTDLGDVALIGWEMRPVLQRAGNGAEILQTFRSSTNPFHPLPLLTMTSSQETRERWEEVEYGKLVYVSPRGKKYLSYTASWSEHRWPLNRVHS